MTPAIDEESTPMRMKRCKGCMKNMFQDAPYGMDRRMTLKYNTPLIRGDRIIARRNPLLLNCIHLALALGNSTREGFWIANHTTLVHFCTRSKDGNLDALNKSSAKKLMAELSDLRHAI